MDYVRVRQRIDVSSEELPESIFKQCRMRMLHQHNVLRFPEQGYGYPYLYLDPYLDMDIHIFIWRYGYPGKDMDMRKVWV